MLLDSHCHLNHYPDPVAAAQAARAQGITAMVVPAASFADWMPIRKLNVGLPLRRCAGIYPLALDAQDNAEALRLLETFPADAIGEIGLDARAPDTLAAQERLFQTQLEIAARRGLPVIIHAVRSLERVLNILRAFSGLRFVVHAFSGSDVQLERLLALGGRVGIGSAVTFPRAQRLRRQAATLPAGTWLLETDAPENGVALPRIAATVAQLRGLSLAELAAEARQACFWEDFYE